MKSFKGYAPAPCAQKPPKSAASAGIDYRVPNMKSSAQGSLQHKRAHMHKDKARFK